MLILIVDDEESGRKLLQRVLEKEHEVILCRDGSEALTEMGRTTFDVVITDHIMPKVSGLELIKKGKDLSPSTTFLLMSEVGSVDQAVSAIQIGAEDYFLKPLDVGELEHRVRRIQELRSWDVAKTFKAETANSHDERLIGHSRAIQDAREFIKRVTAFPSPVLILGPSGSGKEVVALAIHETGPRAVHSFVAINCASLSEQLMESELFGHEKGAFTGAVSATPGKFELARGGTILLDEVGELSHGLQAKLLRVIQENEFYRVGGVRRIKSDARVITATHRNLKEMVKEGKFREDLYFRLHVLTLELTGLAERPEDIPLLIEHFWKRMTKKFRRDLRLTDETMACLNAYSYPGNVRELQNVLERLVVLGREDGDVTPQMLPPEFHIAAGAEPTDIGAGTRLTLGDRGFTEMVEEYERRLLALALRATKNNKVKTAQLLKISRGMLQHKLRKYQNKIFGTVKEEVNTKTDEAA